MRVNPWRERRKKGGRTHVPNSDCKKEKKDPEVKMEPPPRGSTLFGHPEREEFEEACLVEGNCHISLHVDRVISVPNRRIRVRYQRDEECHDAKRPHSTLPNNSETQIIPIDALRCQQEQNSERRDRREIHRKVPSSTRAFPRFDELSFS